MKIRDILDSAKNVLQDKQNVVGEVKAVSPDELVLDAIPGYKNEVHGSAPVEPSIPAADISLAENVLVSEQEGDEMFLEPGSVKKEAGPVNSQLGSRERVSITNEGVLVGNVLLKIDASDVRIVAPEMGPIVITAKLRTAKKK